MRVLRYAVPVDDRWHPIPQALDGRIEAACRQADQVDLWLIPAEGPPVEVRVYGTGHEIPDGADWFATAVTPSGVLVWHVVARGET